MFPVLHLGPLSIQAPGLFLLLGLWLGMSLSEQHSLQFGLRKTHVSNIAGSAVLAGLLGARLAYAAEHPAAYLASPWSLFSLDNSAFAAWGGAAGGLLGALVYLQRQGLSWGVALDALTPLFAVMGLALPLANLASGSGYGIPTAAPWGIELWGTTRHPVQVYEFIAGALILMEMWPSYGIEPPRPAGRTFLRFAALSAGARLVLGVFRADMPALIGGLRSGQALAWLVLAAALYLDGRLKAREAAHAG